MCYVLRGGRELREIVRNVAVGIMKLDLPRMVRTSVFRYLLSNVDLLECAELQIFKLYKSFYACTLMIGGRC